MSNVIALNVHEAAARDRKATKIAARLIAVGATCDDLTDDVWRNAAAAAGYAGLSDTTKAMVRERLASLQSAGTWGGDAA